MKRIYFPYHKWEEVEYGMYKLTVDDKDRKIFIQKAISLLTNLKELEKQMRNTIIYWPNSTAVNMTNPSRNKQAWLGQAACSIHAEVPEKLTKEAWSMLTDEQRVNANLVADKVIKWWKKKYAQNI